MLSVVCYATPVDGHVCDADELVENDAIVLLEHALVIGL
jgi:hypothetical protein